MRLAVVDKLLVVLLEDMITHSLPRIHAIDKHLQTGEVLSEAEVDFFVNQLDRVHQCFELYSKDPKAVHRALNNEKRLLGSAATMSRRVSQFKTSNMHVSA